MINLYYKLTESALSCGLKGIWVLSVMPVINVVCLVLRNNIIITYIFIRQPIP